MRFNNWWRLHKLLTTIEQIVLTHPNPKACSPLKTTCIICDATIKRFCQKENCKELVLLSPGVRTRRWETAISRYTQSGALWPTWVPGADKCWRQGRGLRRRQGACLHEVPSRVFVQGASPQPLHSWTTGSLRETRPGVDDRLHSRLGGGGAGWVVQVTLVGGDRILRFALAAQWAWKIASHPLSCCGLRLILMRRARHTFHSCVCLGWDQFNSIRRPLEIKWTFGLLNLVYVLFNCLDDLINN